MSNYDFDKRVNDIGRKRAVAFFVPRLLVLAAATALVLYVAKAEASPIARMSNAAGGAIILTDDTSETCPKNAYIAYTTAPKSKTMFGCWFADSLFIHIQWDATDVRSYNITDFERVETNGSSA